MAERFPETGAKGYYRNFQQNTMPKIMPVSFCCTYRVSYAGKEPFLTYHDPEVDLRITQLDVGKWYQIGMTPKAARELAAKLVEQADAVEAMCRPKPRPKPDF